VKRIRGNSNKRSASSEEAKAESKAQDSLFWLCFLSKKAKQQSHCGIAVHGFGVSVPRYHWFARSHEPTIRGVLAPVVTAERKKYEGEIGNEQPAFATLGP